MLCAEGDGIFQSTLPAWGVTRCLLLLHLPAVISIHTPRMGSDTFPSTLGVLHNISIHTPRMGSDDEDFRITPTLDNFNPHSPHGE